MLKLHDHLRFFLDTTLKDHHNLEMKYIILFITLSLPFSALANGGADTFNPRALEIAEENKRAFKEKEVERTKTLFEKKDLGIIEYEDHCKKESLEEAAIKGIYGLESNCKKKYYLRLRLLCVDQKSPNIVEIPFPRKNVTITAKNKNDALILSITGVPENGYIQGSFNLKKDLGDLGNALISVEYKDFKKTITAEGAKAPIEVPLSICLR